MNVLLVSHSFEENSREPYSPNVPYSLGLAYIVSFLETKGHEVDILWLDTFEFSSSHKLILSKIEEFKPDVLGIQMFSMNRISSYRLIEYCSEKYPNLKLVIGGIHASIMGEQIVKKYRNVVVVVGEGEITFSELLSAFENGYSLDNIKGLVYWENGKIVKTEERELNYNLDSLPHPKHDVFFDCEPERTTAHIITSRGCPFKCSFCCLHCISKRKYRVRNIDDVIKEIVDLKIKYPRLKTIQIHDDNFTLNNNRVIDLCKKIIALNLDIDFIASGMIKPVSKEMLYYMEKAGFKKLMFGLETGEEKLMLNTHKGIKKKDAEALFYKLKKHNFLITTFLMVGFPGESEDTVNETISFVKKLQKIKYNYIMGIGKLWVYPGTEIYQIMKNENCISDDYWLTDGDVPYFTVEVDLNTLKKFESKMLDHLSILRIFTLNGFIHHFLSMPLVILKFLMLNKYLIKSIIGIGIKINFPGLYPKLRKLYRNIGGENVNA
ncbi:MAG: radical SAM protein [Methanophagales archaeon]|nr:radical SAM protein [Methanophagales archaeon]